MSKLTEIRAQAWAEGERAGRHNERGGVYESNPYERWGVIEIGPNLKDVLSMVALCLLLAVGYWSMRSRR